jgi:hypothetical protein
MTAEALRRGFFSRLDFVAQPVASFETQGEEMGFA